MTIQAPIGQRYIEFLGLLTNYDPNQFNKDVEALFSPSVKKIVNSKTVCTNLTELVGQMQDIIQTHGIKKVNLLELIKSTDPRINVLRFEISYNDNTIESVITIVKCNDAGLIEEINEVFGEKEAYQWEA